MNLGNRIIKIRKDNKMSQDALAELLNVTRQTVSNWENQKNYPDIETLIKIIVEFTKDALYILILDALLLIINETVEGSSYDEISTGVLIFMIWPLVRLFKSNILFGTIISEYKSPSSSK